MIGFWTEGTKDKKSALRFYREALGTFLDDWLEYDLARERVKHLRQLFRDRSGKGKFKGGAKISRYLKVDQGGKARVFEYVQYWERY